MVGEGDVLFTESATLRDWFAVHAPEPSGEDIQRIQQREQQANPHNDNYKPRRRSGDEIKCALRYRYADEMLRVRKEVVI